MDPTQIPAALSDLKNISVDSLEPTEPTEQAQVIDINSELSTSFGPALVGTTSSFDSPALAPTPTPIVSFPGETLTTTTSAATSTQEPLVPFTLPDAGGDDAANSNLAANLAEAEEYAANLARELLTETTLQDGQTGSPTVTTVAGEEQSVVEEPSVVDSSTNEAAELVAISATSTANTTRTMSVEDEHDGGNDDEKEVAEADTVDKNELAEADNDDKNEVVEADNDDENEVAEVDNSEKNGVAEADNDDENEVAEADNDDENEVAEADNDVEKEVAEADNIAVSAAAVNPSEEEEAAKEDTVGKISTVEMEELELNAQQQQQEQQGGNSLLLDNNQSQEEVEMEFTKNYSDDLLMGQNEGLGGTQQQPVEMPSADLADFELPPYSGSSSGSEQRQHSPVKRQSSSNSSAGQAQPSSSQQANITSPPNLSAVKNLLMSSYSRVSHVLHWKRPIETGVIFATGLTLIITLTFFSIISVFAYSALGVILASALIRLYKGVMKTLNKSTETPFDHVWHKVLELNVSLSNEKTHELVDVSVGNLNASLLYFKQVLLLEDKLATLKVGIFLYMLTYIGAWFNGMTLITIIYLALFTTPILYEKNKTKIDEYLNLVTGQLSTTISMVTNKATSVAFGSTSQSSGSSKKQN